MQQTTSKRGGLAELKRKILITFLLLAICRIGVHIPVPGVDSQAVAELFAGMQGTLVGLFDMFTGGGLGNLAIFALGIMPYISAAIIIQLLTVVSPELKRLSKEEGAAGRNKITQYTRYGTVLIATVQGLGIAIGIENMTSPAGVPVVMDPGWGFRITTVMTLVAGTIFLMWLGEQITEYGIGNGISLIICAGIVAMFPEAVMSTFRLMGAGQISLFVAILLALIVVGVLIFIVFIERGQRRIPIQYAKRMLGRKMYGGQTTHLPLKLNTAGVIPPIFASSILMFPATLATFAHAPWLQDISAMFDPMSVLYNLVFVVLIIFFCYFYTAIIFDPKDIAENIRKQGGFVPGIRPGLRTMEYLDMVLNRLTVWGSLYISAICVLPVLLIAQFDVPFYFGGTGVLIVVVVAMDTMSKVDSYLITHQYEGLMQKTRIKGRR
jgi:preprotein translocase subunit SecY